MVNAEKLITDHLPLWSSTAKAKKTTGRGSSKKRELYGVKKLRELILELAVRGLLVPQDSSDEPASELLKRIAEEKEHLVKGKKARKPKTLPLLENEKLPIQLAEGWEWSRFQSLSTSYNVGLDRGKSQQGENLPYRYFKMNNILNTGGFNLSEIVTIIADEVEIEKYSLRSGDLLFNTRNSQELVGKTCVYEEDDAGPVIYNNNILRAQFSEPSVSKMLDLWMRSPLGKSELEKLKSGTTNVWAIYQGKLEGLFCPIPPLAEQHRIVAKVDELMALCDKLEQQQEDSIDTHETLVKTLLDALTTTADPAQFQQAWQRIEANFHLLFTTESSVDHLKQTILQLAVMGKLVPQDPNDEPASQLLKKIAAERELLISKGVLKNRKISFKDIETPFRLPIPPSWELCKIGSLAFLVTDGTHKTPQYKTSGIRFVSAKDVKSGDLTFEDCKHISIDEHNELIKRCKPEFGDLLVSKSGSIGTVVKVTESGEFSLFESLALIKISQQHLSPDYFRLAFQNTCHGMTDDHIRGVAVKHLHLNVLRGMEIEIPPLAEQHRIVAKVDSLMTLCDTLKAKLQSAQTTQQTLTDTIVEKAVV